MKLYKTLLSYISILSDHGRVGYSVDVRLLLLQDTTDPRQVESGYSIYFTYPVYGKVYWKA